MSDSCTAGDQLLYLLCELEGLIERRQVLRPGERAVAQARLERLLESLERMRQAELMAEEPDFFLRLPLTARRRRGIR
jgi:hypothetical protein